MKKLYLGKKYGKRPKKLIICVCVIVIFIIQMAIPIISYGWRVDPPSLFDLIPNSPFRTFLPDSVIGRQLAEIEAKNNIDENYGTPIGPYLNGWKGASTSLANELDNSTPPETNEYYSYEEKYEFNYAEIESNNIGVVGYNSEYGSKNPQIWIPASINNKTVISVGTDAFINDTTVESAWFDTTVKTINWNAFNGCSNMNYLDLNCVETIRSGAFANTGITMLTIPNSVRTIEDYAFSNTNLTDVIIPKTVTNISSSAFDGCQNLKIYYYEGTAGKNAFASDSRAISMDGNSNYIYEDYTSTNGTTGKIITKYLGLDLNVQVPQQIGGVNVIALGVQAFANRTDISTVVLNSNIKEIGGGAFYNCTNLTSITDMGNVVQIGNYAFQGCSKLSNITIPNGVTSLEDGVFHGCSSLSSITIPNNVTQIKDFVFAHSGLTNIALNNNITSIGRLAFYNCQSLTSVTLPQNSSFTKISNELFKCCTSLTSITIPSTVTEIGNSAFHTTGLISIIIPNTVTKIDNYTFAYCENLQSITLPNNITKIGDLMFYDCKSLLSVSIPNSVSNVGWRAFMNCESLVSIELPINGDFKTIKSETFKNCKSLTEITIKASIEIIEYEVFFGCSELSNVNIEEDSALTTIGNAAFHSSGITNITLPNTVTSLGYYTFAYCENLENINLSTSITEIKRLTFYNCTNLSRITIPDGVITIEAEAFKCCTKLSYITIPNTVTTIGNSAFHSSGIENITIPNSVTSLGYYTFAYCYNLQSITLSNQITEIGPLMFFKCISLKNINIPDSVKGIGFQAFQSCSNLEEVTLSNSLENIGDFAFISCDNLKSLVVKNPNIEYIGEALFAASDDIVVYVKETNDEEIFLDKLDFDVPTILYSINNDEVTIKSCYTINDTIEISDKIEDKYIKHIANGTFNPIIIDGQMGRNTHLKSIKLPVGLQSIGDRAFENSKIESIQIPDTVNSIGIQAFKNCKNLTQIELPIALTSISNLLFEDCTNLQTVIMDRNLVTIGNTPFENCQKLKEINVSINNENFSSISGVLFDKMKTRLIIYPVDKSDTTYIVPEGVTDISALAFTCVLNLTEVILPESLKTIGNSAFYNDSNLKSLTLPQGITTIGDNAFECCTNLNNVKFAKTLTSIGNYAFKDCLNLTSVIIPNTVTNVGQYAFIGDTLTMYCNSTSPAKDCLGLTNAIGNITIITDDEAPNVIVTKSTESFTSSDVTLTITAEDTGVGIVPMAYSFDNGETWQAENTKTFSENTNVEIKVIDALDNVKSQSVGITNIDKIRPTVELNNESIENNGTYYYKEDVSIKITEYSGIASYKLYKNLERDDFFTKYATISEDKKELTATIAEEGTFDLIAIDEAGNTSKVTFMIDKLNPQLEITAIDKSTLEEIKEPIKTENEVGYYKNVKFQVEFAEENVAELYYTKNNGNIIYMDPNIKTSIIDGSTGTYVITLVDLAGNTVTKTVVVDNEKPVAPTIESLNDGWASSSQIMKLKITPSSNTTISGMSAIQYRIISYTGNNISYTGEWQTLDQTTISPATITVDFPNRIIQAHEVIIQARVVNGVGTPSNTVQTRDSSENEFANQDKEIPEINVVVLDTPTIYSKEHSARIVVTDESGLKLEKLKYSWSASNTVAGTTKTSMDNATYDGEKITIGSIAKTPEGINGTYYLWIEAEDINGNRNNSVAKNDDGTAIAFRLDNTPPTITLEGFTKVEETYYGKTSVIPEIKDNNEPNVTVSTVTLEKYLEDWTQVTYTKGTQIQREGSYRIKAIDSLGNESEWIYFIIDKTAPVIKVNESSTVNGETYYYKNPVPLDIIGEKEYEITKNEETITFNKDIDLIGGTGDGIYTIKALDIAKNETLITVIIDSQAVEAPTLSAKKVSTNEEYEFNTWTNDNVILSINIENEPLSGINVYEKYEINVNDTGSWYEIPKGQTIIISNEGTTTIKVRGVNNAGTVGVESAVYTLKLDKTAPKLTAELNNTNWTKENILLNITSTDVTSGVKEVKVNDTKVELSQQGTNTFTISENGRYTVTSIDNAGNITEKVIDVNNIDKQNPNIEVTGNSTNWTNKDITLTINAEDVETGIACVSIEKILGEDQTISQPIVLTLVNKKTEYVITENGEYKIVATDNAGNKTEQIIEVTKIDKTAPTVTGVTGNSTSWTNQDVTLTVENATDVGGSTLDELTYSFDCGANWQNANSKVFTENTSNIVIKVRDAAGNIYTHAAININKIDKVVPVITILPNGKTTDRPTNVTVSVAEEGGSRLSSSDTYQYYLSTSKSELINGDWKTFIPGTAFEIGTGLSTTYYMHIKEISDNAGNKTSAVSEAFIFDNELPEENPNPTESFQILSDVYTISNGTMLKIQPNTTAATFKSNIRTNADSVKIYDISNTQIENASLVMTGMTLKIKKGTTEQNINLIITGDATGDGNADFKDIVTINKHRLNKKILTENYLKAADVTEDGIVDFKDIVQINKYRLGKINSL